MAQHISTKLDMKQMLVSSIEFNFLQPISQQICPSWLPIDWSATVIMNEWMNDLYFLQCTESKKMNPSLYSLSAHKSAIMRKTHFGLLLQFCFLDAMFTSL